METLKDIVKDFKLEKPEWIKSVSHEEIEADKQQERAEREIQWQKNRIENNRKIGITSAKYRDMTFTKDNNSMPEVTRKCKFFADNFEKYKTNEVGLLLWGETGSGKTFMAAAIANKLIDKGYKAIITNLTDIIRGQMDFDNAELNLRRLLEFECIVLDDVGVNRSTPYADEIVQTFIDKCIVNKTVIVATTNYTKKIMQEIIDSQSLENLAYSRLFSRLLGNCESVRVSGVKNRENELAERLKEIHGDT